MQQPDLVSQLARQLGVDSVVATSAAGSGHPTSSLSAADLLAVLLVEHFRFDVDQPAGVGNDRLVFSKGHAAPLLYAGLRSLGIVSQEDLRELRRAGSALQGHPVPGLPMIDVATGSLGQGLANGLGMALGLRHRGSPARVWVLSGDSEMAEGSVWEALALASHHGASNLALIVDVNRLGQTGPTMYGWDTSVYTARLQAFGWDVVEVDGHDHGAIDSAMRRIADSDRPGAIVARTVKGHGVSFLEDVEGMHGKPIDADQVERAVRELGGGGDLVVTPAAPLTIDDDLPSRSSARDRSLPSFEEPVSTREAFGEALAAAAASDPRLIVLDAEVGNSTKTEEVAEESPGRFVQMYIAEQAMVGAAVGLQATGLRPVVSSFAAFLTRAHDFFRMGAISRADLIVGGSHAGVSIGEDGPSQMGLEDLAMFRALEATVLYPADGTSTVALLDAALDRPGIVYLRTTRGETPALYPSGTTFPVGGSHTLRSSVGDVATVVTAGVTLFEALEAADVLAAGGEPVRVIDVYSIQPIDVAALQRAATETGAIVTVEDHRGAGGLGDAVLEAIAGVHGCRARKLAVTGTPGSASPDEQRRLAGISAGDIVEAVISLAPARV